MEPLETVLPATTFASLTSAGPRWGSFGLGYFLQAVLLVGFAKVGITWAAPVLNPVDKTTEVHLVAPDLSEPKAPPVEAARPRPIPPPPHHVINVPKPRIEARLTPPPVPVPPQPQPEIAKVIPPAPAPKTDNFTSKVAAPAPKVERKVAMANFGGSSAPATLNLPARKVQTGGFGDPNGVPVNPNSTGKGPMIAKVGSFDLPPGPGTGNGTGGAKGARGTVASAGFGNGVAVQGEGGKGGGAGQGSVRSSGFGAVEAAPEAPKRPAPQAVAPETPVSLLSKPAPTYTPEARQRKVEGDVELEVEFTANGKVHVIRVVRGLGYGLDEAAVQAAQQIRFSPARRDGQPVDSEARLRIVFRLS